MAYNHHTGDGDRIFAPIFADVWESDLKKMNGSDVKVYVALLLHTTQHDRTWFMSIDEMAEDAGVGRSTAAAAKDRLVESGLICQTWRYRDEAGDYHLTDTRPPPRLQGKNVYKVNVRPQYVESENRTHGSDRVQKSEPIESENRTLVESENRKQTRTPSPEPPPEPLSPLAPQGADGASAAEGDPAMARFQEFYDVYDRKKKRPDAERAWKKAVKKADPQVIIDAAVVFIESQKATNKHPQYTPFPATWLNGEQWNDEIDFPASGQHQGRSTNDLGDWLPPSRPTTAQLTYDADLLNANVIDHQEDYQ